MSLREELGDRIRRIPVQSTVLRVRVETPPETGAYERAHDVVRRWLADIFHRHGITLNPNEPMRYTDTAHEVREQGGDGIAVFRWRHPDRRHEGHEWTAEAALRRAESGAATFDMRFRVRHPYGDEIDPYPPVIFRKLLSETGLCDAGRALAPHPMRPRTSDEMDAFFALVNDARRTLPILAISEPIAIDLQTCVEQLAGIAHIVVLDTARTWAITERYGKEHGVYAGAVRLYPAESTMQSSLKEAPRWLSEMLEGREGRPDGLATIRRALLATVTEYFERRPLELAVAPTPSAAPPPESAVGANITLDPHTQIAELTRRLDETRSRLDDALREIDETRLRLEETQAETARLNKRVAELEKEKNDYFAEWNKSEERVKLLEQQLDTQEILDLDELDDPDRRAIDDIIKTLLELKNRLKDRKRLLDDCESLRRLVAASYSRAPVRSPSESVVIERPQRWNDFDALRRWVESLSGGRVVLHERVRERLQEGNVENPDALLDILQIICTDLVAFRRGEKGARERFYERLKPYKQGRALTATGAGRIRDDYSCTFEGKTYGPEDHWHVRQHGTDFEGRHACVYYVELDDGRILITSMPKHLATANDFT
jgi:hypothetical protein